MASSNYTPSGGRQELMTIRESEEGGTTITDTMETTGESSDSKIKKNDSSTLTVYSLENRKSRWTGNRDSAVPMQRWAVIKENLFTILLEMQSRDKRKEKAIEEANIYANEAKGWDVMVKVESESDFASAKTDMTTDRSEVEAANDSTHRQCGENCTCCGLRRRKYSKAERSRNIGVPNTHISCRTTTFQELFTIVQDDAITYEDCVREYYQPIIEEIGFFGWRKFHFFLWIAIGLHVFLILSIIVDVIAYKIEKVAYTTQEFTASILLLHIFSFVFSALSFIYVTQLGVVRGSLQTFCHFTVFFSVISIITRAMVELDALDHRREIFNTGTN